MKEKYVFKLIHVKFGKEHSSVSCFGAPPLHDATDEDNSWLVNRTSPMAI